MYSISPSYYELIYSLKDYKQESDQLVKRLRELRPNAKDILDVACGTGLHAQHLTEQGYRVHGVDIQPEFIELATSRNPGSKFFIGDMVNLDVGSRYDVVLCLFSAIGYVRSVESLQCTFRGFARHLKPGGLAIVEPFLEPVDFIHGTVHMKCVANADAKICRMNCNEVVGTVARLRFEYLVGDSTGVKHFSEVQELGLFTRHQIEEALQSAGFSSVVFDETGLPRGMYLSDLHA